MKWFKHYADASDDEFMVLLEDQFGLEGYARWWKMLEAIAYQMKNPGQCSASYPIQKWCSLLKAKRKQLLLFLEVTGKQSKTKSELNGNILTIECRKLLEIKDEYSKKSRHSPDKVPPKSIEVEEEIDKEKNKDTAPPALPSPPPTVKPVQTQDDKLKRYRENPDKSWNAFLVAYHDAFGNLPTWAEGVGSKQEYTNLSGLLSKLNGDKEKLLGLWKIYLQDTETYLQQGGHRPSLLIKRLDGYLNNGAPILYLTPEEKRQQAIDKKWGIV